MPDGDRFEWRLRGKGWRGVYRLLCAGAENALVSDHAIKAVAAYLRSHTDTSYRGFIDAVAKALSSPTLDVFVPESGLSGAAAVLATRLESEVAAHQYSEAALLAQRSAWKTFVRLDSNRQAVAREKVAQEFGGEFSCEIAERRCLGIMRDQVIEKRNRTLDEQVAKEASLKNHLRLAGQQLGKQLDADNSLTDVRAPRRGTATREFTEQDLHKPLIMNADPQ